MNVYCISLRRRVTSDYRRIGWKLKAEDGTVLEKGGWLNPLKRKLEERFKDTEIKYIDAPWEEI